MNKFIITGLALANDFGFGCPCNIDFQWLLNRPATLLWTDKIIITKEIFDRIIKEEHYPDSRSLGFCIRTIFEKLAINGMLETIDSSYYVDNDIGKHILTALNEDMNELCDYDLRDFKPKFSKKDKEKFEGVKFGKYDYCIPHLLAIYASLMMSKVHNANCLFDEPYYYYVNKLLKSKSNAHLKMGQANNQNHVLLAQLIIPEIVTLPFFPDGDKKEKCFKCDSFSKCTVDLVRDFELKLKDLFEYREYDEFYLARELIEKISDRYIDNVDDKQLIDMKNEFDTQIIINRKLVRKRFPGIKRGLSITAAISGSVAIFGSLLHSPEAIYTGTAIGAASYMGTNIIDYLSSRLRWSTFITRKF